MLVSIIIPVFNTEAHIDQTIDCLLRQNYQNFEVIIINDCSEDNTLFKINKIKDPRFKIINLKKNKGVAFCRNLGMRKSSGKYISFLDSDDLFKPTKLNDQISFMEKLNLDFSYTKYDIINSSGSVIKKVRLRRVNNFENFVKNTSIATSTMMMKKDIIKTTKFDKRAFGFDDYLFKCKILKKIIRVDLLESTLSSYRIRKKSLSSNSFRNFVWVWKINKKFNNFNFIYNLYCLLNISLNSLRKYRFMKFF